MATKYNTKAKKKVRERLKQRQRERVEKYATSYKKCMFCFAQKTIGYVFVVSVQYKNRIHNMNKCSLVCVIKICVFIR